MNRCYGVPLFLSLLALVQTGCSVLVGNIKPITEKSERYSVLELSEKDPDWIRLPPDSTVEKNATEGERQDKTDLAYQSKSTSSIISLSSACRERIRKDPKNLRQFTDLLLLGVSNISDRNERTLRIHEVPALETTIKGRMNKESIVLRTVVLRNEECIFDLMYVSRPESFEKQALLFSQFVGSLRLE